MTLFICFYTDLGRPSFISCPSVFLLSTVIAGVFYPFIYSYIYTCLLFLLFKLLYSLANYAWIKIYEIKLLLIITDMQSPPTSHTLTPTHNPSIQCIFFTLTSIRLVIFGQKSIVVLDAKGQLLLKLEITITIVLFNSIFHIFRWGMMTSSNGNIFRDTGLLCGEFTGHRWIPRTKASEAEL